MKLRFFVNYNFQNTFEIAILLQIIDKKKDYLFL